MGSPAEARAPRRRTRGLDLRPGAIRQARLEAGLSLSQLAGESVSRAAISAMEHGRIRPSPATLQLIADRTGKEVAYFLAEPQPPLEELELLVARREFAQAVDAAAALLARPGLAPLARARGHLRAAEANLHLTRPEASLEHLQQAEPLFAAAGDAWRSAECLLIRAQALYLLEDPGAAAVAERALIDGRNLDPAPPNVEWRALTFLASIALDQRDWKRAVKLYRSALRAAEPVRNLRQAALLNEGLGMAYHRLGMTRQASECFTRALTLYETQRDMSSLARAEINLSEVLTEQGQLDEAERHLRSSLRLCDEFEVGRRNFTYALVGLADVQLRRGELEAAVETAREAIELSRERGELQHEAAGLQVLARAEFDSGHPQAADATYLEALAAWEKTGLLERQRRCHIEYARLLDEQGRLPEAKAQWMAAALAAEDAITHLREEKATG